MHNFIDINNMSYEELLAKRINIIGFNPDNINECLKAVKKDGFTLQYIKEQTPEICLEAVKTDGLALKFVKEQTPEICLEAVKKDGLALQYVKEQTPEICLEAVRTDGLALQYVKEQTKDICIEAVKQFPYAIEYVKEQAPEICLLTIKQNGFALQYVREQTPEICLEAIKQNELALKYVKDIDMLCCRRIDIKNDTGVIDKELLKREKAIAVVELFEHLLDCKKIDIPCSDEREQLIRYQDGNCARIYGMEYYNLVDAVMNEIYEPTNSSETTNGFKSILEEAGRYESSIEILNYMIKYFVANDDDEVKYHLYTYKCKDQAAQILKVITDEVIIDKDDLVGNLDDIYYHISTEADIMLHEYAINQSHRTKPIYDIEDIRSYLVLADLILNLNTKNENPDKSWSVPEGLERKK